MAIWNNFLFRRRDAAKSVETSGVVHRSQSINVYHCCVQKTGSQWIRKILSDPIVYTYSGLKAYHYQSTRPGGSDSRDFRHRTFTEPFPANTILSPVYILFDNFTAVPKPEHYKAFFVMRDPRDIVVSWYFSMRHSHVPMGNVPTLRAKLRDLSLDDGMAFAIDHLDRSGHFGLLASWVDAPITDHNVLLVRFEDLIGPASGDVFEKLFSHCDIPVPTKQLSKLLAKYSFRAISGRAPGREYVGHHYRKGVSGDWKNYLRGPLAARFNHVAGDLLSRLGYPE